jgi:signal transduction histidine kinase
MYKLRTNTLVSVKFDFELKESLIEVLKQFEIKSQSKGIKISFFFHQNVPLFINQDQRAVKQIIRILVGNSVKHSN